MKGKLQAIVAAASLPPLLFGNLRATPWHITGWGPQIGAGAADWGWGNALRRDNTTIFKPEDLAHSRSEIFMYKAFSLHG